MPRRMLAARLKLAMDDLRKHLAILTGIGNMFINLATTIVEQITRMFNAINNARAAQALGWPAKAQTRFDEAAENLRLQQRAFEQADDKINRSEDCCISEVAERNGGLKDGHPLFAPSQPKRGKRLPSFRLVKFG